MQMHGALNFLNTVMSYCSGKHGYVKNMVIIAPNTPTLSSQMLWFTIANVRLDSPKGALWLLLVQNTFAIFQLKIKHAVFTLVWLLKCFSCVTEFPFLSNFGAVL